MSTSGCMSPCSLSPCGHVGRSKASLASGFNVPFGFRRARLSRAGKMKFHQRKAVTSTLPQDPGHLDTPQVHLGRRGASTLLALVGIGTLDGDARASEKQVFDAFNKFPGFTETPSGLQYLDVRIGEGTPAEMGKKVVVDWDGYTIHLGRIIEAKMLTKGGAFQADESMLLRFVLGDGSVIPAWEEAISGMSGGGIRRIVVPPGPLSYPYQRDGTQSFKTVGPMPSTFSGQRALDFVLKNNGNIDKSLLFDIELLEISPSGAARRGPGQVAAGAGVSSQTSNSASVDWGEGRGARLTNGLYNQ